MKKLLLLILSLAILGCKQETSLEKTQNTWQKLEKKVLDIRVSATGKVLPWLSIEIKCKASGLIDELPFIESSLVKKGDLLLGLDPIDEERRLKSAEVSLNVAKSRQEQAIINYDLAKEELELRRAEARSNLAYLKSRHKEAKNNYLRINDLIKQNLSSDQDLELATTQKALAESELKKAEIRLKDLDLEEKRIGLKKLELAIASEDVKSKEVALELANQALADTLVYAPMDGVLTSLKVQIGQIIASGISNIGGGTTIMTLANTERLIVRAMVDESDIAKVKLNQKAYFTVDSFLFKRFLGEVIRISAMGETTNNVVLFQVDIEVTDQDKHLLKPEMSAAIDIELDLNDEVLCVPYQAIYEDRGRPWVMAKIKDNSEPQKTFVELGFDDGECFSVISGLNSESQVQITSMQANTFEKQDKHKIRF